MVALSGIALCVALSCLPDVEIPKAAAPAACGDGVVQLSFGEDCDPGDATAPGCTSECRLSCDGGVVDPRTNHCYYVTGASAALAAAQQACAQTGGHLITFASADELAFVTTRSGIDGGAWIDLTRTVLPDGAPPIFSTKTDEPGWSKSCPGCYANIGTLNPTGFFPVVEGGVDGPCVVFSPNDSRSWFAVPCDLGAANITLPILCEREPPGRPIRPCDAGQCIELRPTFGDKTYVFVTMPQSFEDAQKSCAALASAFPESKAQRLVVLQTREEREELARAIAMTDTREFWIGLSAAFVWSDGEPIEGGTYPSPYGRDEPASKAPSFVRIDDEFDTRHAHTGTAPRPFVCEIKLR
jgi:hypothetical protein